MAQKLRNREGVEIDYTGDPLPARPNEIPKTAGWYPNEELWKDGKWRGRIPKRFGLWRTWSADGDIQELTDYHEGNDLAAIGDIEESHGNPLIEAARLQDREADVLAFALQARTDSHPTRALRQRRPGGRRPRALSVAPGLVTASPRTAATLELGSGRDKRSPTETALSSAPALIRTLRHLKADRDDASQ